MYIFSSFTGTWKVYSFLRREMRVPFYYGQSSPDALLEKIHSAITQNKLAALLPSIFESEGTERTEQEIIKERPNTHLQVSAA